LNTSDLSFKEEIQNPSLVVYCSLRFIV